MNIAQVVTAVLVFASSFAFVSGSQVAKQIVVAFGAATSITSYWFTQHYKLEPQAASATKSERSTSEGAANANTIAPRRSPRFPCGRI